MIYEKIGDQDISKDLTIESLGKRFKNYIYTNQIILSVLGFLL